MTGNSAHLLKGTREQWKEAARSNALFLSIATQLNSRQLLPVFEWFQKRLVVIIDPTTLNSTLTLNILRDKEGKERVLPFLREADPGIADIDAQREALPLSGGLVIASQGSHILEPRLGNEPPLLWKITVSHKGADDSESLTRKGLGDFSHLWLVGVASNDGAARCRGPKPPAANIGATG